MRFIYDSQTQEFLKYCLKGFIQHGYDHAAKVAHNALEIAENFENLNLSIIEVAALFHDVLDEKNPNKIRKYHVVVFLEQWFTQKEISMILEIMDNISTRKEMRGERKEVHTPYLWIVSDADKLEALGKHGIERCFEYQKDKIICERTRFEYVYNLFRTQYSRKYFSNFIITDYARDKAEILFSEQEAWLALHIL